MFHTRYVYESHKPILRLNAGWRFAFLGAVTFLVLMLLSVSAAIAAGGASVNGLMLTPRAQNAADDGVTASPPSRSLKPFAAPVLASEIDIAITGPLARTTVRQMFANTQDKWVEGTYVFPLPELVAVDSLRMLVDGRVIQGVVKEREAARRTYEKARQLGQKASLVTQERPNIFTTAVANIAPKGRVAVEIGFQESLRWENGHFELRVPTVIGTRFIPGQPGVTGVGGTGVIANTNQVPDAERITPPQVPPSAGPINPVAFTITLDAGVNATSLESPTHDLAVDTLDDGRVRVSLKDGSVPADRDFVLHFAPQAGDSTAVRLFREMGTSGEAYLMALVQPPKAETILADGVPREVVFIVDTSGSMDGTSIQGARAALLKALDGLRPGDRFNIVRFSNVTSALYADAQPVSYSSLTQARQYVRNLDADGGTQILPALQRTLNGGFDTGRVRQVILLTDGSVGNEAELLTYVRRMRGDTRVFTIGIGSAPNSYMMRTMAEMGRGTFTYIADTNEVAEKMTTLFAKLEAPAMGDIDATFAPAARADVWPQSIPDLYAGEPLVVVARVEDLKGPLSLDGVRGNKPWRMELPLAQAIEAPGIAKLWARRKIKGLMDQRFEGAHAEDVRLAVLDVALAHQLVSKYTSLVAVDTTPARPAGEGMTSHAMPTNLPHGWTLKGMFNQLQALSPSQLMRLQADAQFARDQAAKRQKQPKKAQSTKVQAKAQAPAPAAQQIALNAQTATPAERQLLAGLLGLMIGLVLLAAARAKRGGRAS